MERPATLRRRIRAIHVVQIAGEQVGFNDRTLRRAYKAIGIPARKESFDGPWLWRLTPASDQPPEHDDTFDFPNL